jgi:putative hydrolase of the HAD superfamily
MATKNKETAVKAIFFDAAGTLLQLTKTVGQHYTLVGTEIGLNLEPDKLDRAFVAAWNQMPKRPPIDGPRPNDDKDWWRALVDLVLDQTAPELNEFDRDNFFEIAYEHFAEAGVWELYPEVIDVLASLRPRFQLAVISNFDGRLRFILEHLGISKFFKHILVSSELGADKPDPEIFRRGLKVINLEADQVLHVGDDPERDWKAAATAGLSVFKLDRTKNSLRDLVQML